MPKIPERQSAPSPAHPMKPLSESKRWQFTIGAWSASLAGITTFIAGAMVMLVIAWWNGQLRTLQFAVQPESGIFKPVEGMDKKITILVGDEQVDNLSRVVVYLFNNTDSNFEDVPVYITLSSPNDRPLRILSKSESIAEDRRGLTTKEEPREVRYAYRFPTVNKGSSAFFSASFVVEGPQAPRVTVEADEVGVVLEEVPAERLRRAGDSPSIFTSVVALVVVGTLFGVGINAVGSGLFQIIMRSWTHRASSPANGV